MPAARLPPTPRQPDRLQRQWFPVTTQRVTSGGRSLGQAEPPELADPWPAALGFETEATSSFQESGPQGKGFLIPGVPVLILPTGELAAGEMGFHSVTDIPCPSSCCQQFATKGILLFGKERPTLAPPGKAYQTPLCPPPCNMR